MQNIGGVKNTSSNSRKADHNGESNTENKHIYTVNKSILSLISEQNF